MRAIDYFFVLLLPVLTSFLIHSFRRVTMLLLYNLLTFSHFRFFFNLTQTGDDAASSAATTPAKPTTTSAATGKEVKPFQRLQFLVRDWQNFDTEYEESGETEEDKQVFSKVHQEMQKYLSDVSFLLVWWSVLFATFACVVWILLRFPNIILSSMCLLCFHLFIY